MFKCWIDPQLFEKWGLCPEGTTCRLLHADVRPGGHYHVREEWPDGKLVYTKFEFRRIRPNEELVFVTSLSDETGKTVEHPFWPEWPTRLLATVNFEDDESGVNVNVLWEPLEPSDSQIAFFMQHIDMGRIGWSQTFDRLQTTIEWANQQATKGTSFPPFNGEAPGAAALS